MFEVDSYGWLAEKIQCKSPNFNERPDGCEISLLVIHNISLPAGQFNTGYISQLFTNSLNCDAHPSFEDLKGVKVSAHCMISRNGDITQYVSFDDRAWHAGVSLFNDVENCNDYSIGIELEGTDDLAYTHQQYQSLTTLTKTILKHYPAIGNNIVGHCDIAPGRKTDPGNAFNWSGYFSMLAEK